MQLIWFGNYSFVVRIGSFVVLIDPQGFEENFPIADLIIVTQWHYAHCNRGIIQKCMHDNTAVLGTPEVASHLHPCSVLAVGESRLFEGDRIEVFGMPAVNDRPGLREKPESRVGFVLHAKGKKLFFIGDSDFVEGMEDVHPDVLVIPVGGTLTLNAKEAADVVDIIAPKLSIPVHWGGLVGSRVDAEYFCEQIHERGHDCKLVEQGEVTRL